MNLRISITLTIVIKKKDFLNGELQNCVEISLHTSESDYSILLELL